MKRPSNSTLTFIGLLLIAVIIVVAVVLHGLSGDYAGSHKPANPSAIQHPAVGLSASANDTKLHLLTRSFHTGIVPLRFAIQSPDGLARTRFETVEASKMHLVVARTDLGTYQHLHPKLGSNGIWTANVHFRTPGSYQIIVDFQPVGAPRTALSAEVSVGPGSFQHQAIPAPVQLMQVDGFDVHIDASRITHKSGHRLKLTITRNGSPAQLKSEEGNYGLAVLLRIPDLAYVHTIAIEPQPAKGIIVFTADLPTPGRYEAFVEFEAEGAEHLARFTIDSRTTAPAA